MCRAQAQPRVDLEAAGSSGVVSDISICFVVDCWKSITFGIKVNNFLVLLWYYPHFQNPILLSQ